MMHRSFRTVMAVLLACVMLLALSSTTLADAPAAPQGAKLKKTTTSSISFTWTKVKTAVKYEIYRSDTPDGEYARVGSVKSNSFTNSKLAAGTEYCYYIVALNKAGESSEPSAKFAASTKGTAKAAAGSKSVASVKTNEVLDAEYKKVVDASKLVADVQDLYLKLLNDERAKAGAKPLTISNELMKTAAVKAADMYNNRYFNYDHSSPTYGSLEAFGKKLTGHAIGENIMDATSSLWRNDYSNAAVMGNDKFMNSTLHRDNRLHAPYKTVGFCIYDGGDRIVIVEHFYF